MHEGDREFQQLLSYRLCLKHCWHHITVLVWALTSFRPHRLATRNACHVMSMWCCCKCTIRVSWFLGPIKSKWHHTQDKKRLCQWDLHETWRLLNLQPRAETSFRISMRFEIFWVGFIPSNNAGECPHGLAASWNQHMVLQRHLVCHDSKDPRSRRRLRSCKMKYRHKQYWKITWDRQTSQEKLTQTHCFVTAFNRARPKKRCELPKSMHALSFSKHGIIAIELQFVRRCSRDSLHWSPELKFGSEANTTPLHMFAQRDASLWTLDKIERSAINQGLSQTNTNNIQDLQKTYKNLKYLKQKSHVTTCHK